MLDIINLLITRLIGVQTRLQKIDVVNCWLFIDRLLQYLGLLRPREWWWSIVMSTSVCVCVCVCVCYVCVCLSVCLSASISPKPHAVRAISTKFSCPLPGRGSVLLRRRCEIPRGRGNFGVFFPIDNALYRIAFGTHTYTAEPIEMPFWMKTRVGPIQETTY